MRKESEVYDVQRGPSGQPKNEVVPVRDMPSLGALDCTADKYISPASSKIGVQSLYQTVLSQMQCRV